MVFNVLDKKTVIVDVVIVTQYGLRGEVGQKVKGGQLLPGK